MVNMVNKNPSSYQKEKEECNHIQDMDLLENLIRKTYHDGANIFGPLREIISLKFESSLADYIVNNFTYYISLLKNLRFVYLFQKSPKCFRNSNFSIKKILEELLIEGREKYRTEEKETSLYPLSVTGPEEAVIALFSNLLVNAFRFGEDISVRVEGSRVIIHNTVVSCISSPVKSIYELPITHDKFGILGAGVGLKIVKGISDYLNIGLEGKVGEDDITIVIDMTNLME